MTQKDPGRLPRRVARFCDGEGLLPRGCHVLVAFSGGPDSLALLGVLSAMAGERGLRVSALHLDHGLRTESGAEARRAQTLAAELGVDCQSERLEGLSMAAGNLEERARVARRKALEAHADARGADRIALGHHADDQAETVLLRLLRGAGPRGLGAMAPRQGIWIRPLLTCRQGDLEAYLEAKGLTPLRDPSNEHRRFARNRLRHDILPVLEKENPRVVDALCRVAASSREDSEALQGAVQRCFGEAFDGGALRLSALRRLPTGLLHGVLRLAVSAVAGDGRRLSREHIVALARLCREVGGQKELHLPRLRARRSYDLVRVELADDPGESSETFEAFETFEIVGPGSFELGPRRTLEVALERASSDRGLGLPLDGIEFPLVVRVPRPGERLCIERIGRQRHRKISRILIDAKIPRGERNAAPVVCIKEGDVPLLVVGVRRAAGLGYSPGAAVLRIWVQRTGPRNSTRSVAGSK